MCPSLRKMRSCAVLIGLAVLTAAAIGQPAQAGPADGSASSPRDCQVSQKLVNSCRPWLGARAADYPDAGGSLVDQHEHHENRIGRKLDIAHTFAAEGELPLATDDERQIAERDNTYLYQNWKPAASWQDAGGGNAEMDQRIDAAADNIKSVTPNKIFMTIHHEPENDVSSDTECDTRGASGTVSQYRDMWHNVRERFDAKQVDNVVWVMDYMNYSRWDCLVPKLYPGDNFVDWIMFNGYGDGGNADFADNVGRFYSLLTELSSNDMDLLSKPWGIVEWGINESTQQQARNYYDQAAESIEDGRFPKLAAYMIFDSPGTHDEGGLRVGFDDNGNRAPQEQEQYNAFANSPVFEP